MTPPVLKHDTIGGPLLAHAHGDRVFSAMSDITSTEKFSTVLVAGRYIAAWFPLSAKVSTPASVIAKSCT